MRWNGEKLISSIARWAPIRFSPRMPGPHITLAGVLAEQGKQPEAAAERKTAADLTRVAVNHQRATFATNSGKMLLEKGQIEGCHRPLPGGAVQRPKLRRCPPPTSGRS
jgi:hypothetical protein